MDEQKLRIAFSGLIFDLISEIPLGLSPELQPFLTEETLAATDSYRISVLHHPLPPEGELFFQNREVQVYAKGKDRLFYFRTMADERGLVPVCRITDRGEHQLYFPEDWAERLREEHRLSGLMCMEQLLLRHNALLFHSSVVCHRDQVILFSGPSGIGKSTQAALWEQCYGAEILNGDRCILRIDPHEITGGGSPWCGSSGIYNPKHRPVKAILLLRQGKENRLERARPSGAFPELYAQCIIHPWDKAFVNTACDLLMELLNRIPVYTLSCLPDPSAAQLTHQSLFSPSPVSHS